MAQETNLQTLDEILKGDLAYPLISVGETCRLEKGRFSSTKTAPGPYPFVVTAAEKRTADDYQFDQAATCIPLISSTGHGRASLHRLHYEESKFALADLLVALLPLDPGQLNAKFLCHTLQHKKDELLVPLMKGAANVSMNPDDLKGVMFPLPPIKTQFELVDRLEKQEAVIDGAEKILGNWSIQPSIFEGDEVSLREIANFGAGSTPARNNPDYFNGKNNWVLTTEISEVEIYDTQEKLSDAAIQDYSLRIYPVNTILIAMYGQGQTRGRTALLKIPAAVTQNTAAVVIDEEKANPYYVWYYLRSIYDKIRGQDYSGAGVPHLNLKIIQSIHIPLPSLKTQTRIVEKINEEITSLENVRFLKTQAEKRIQQILDEIWGE